MALSKAQGNSALINRATPDRGISPSQAKGQILPGHDATEAARNGPFFETLRGARDHGIVILRLKELLRRTGLSRSAVYYKMDHLHRLYDPNFPKSVRLSLHGSAVGWVEHECEAWLESRITASRPLSALENHGVVS